MGQKHCISIINFDGGGSSTLWTRKRGVINHPSDNKKWDHAGERSVANVLYYSK
ncbi:phosphodiester glycosidase family protein [Niabella hirudinis]|uniref:phosphodiester glycosidase family protein n=1 Tax=Niabella hirudinis TaxID=1285929 RepID=UPI003EBF83BD